MIDFQFIDTKIIQLKNSNYWLKKLLLLKRNSLEK